MNNASINRVIFLGALAVIGIIAVQTYLLKNTWNAEEREFQEKVMIALQNVAKQFEKLGTSLPAYDLISKVSSNYFVVNVNDNVRPSNLEHFLRSEMEAVGLREDFEYGIYNCDSKKMAYGKYISYSANLGEKTVAMPKEQLPVYDEYTYYFGVRFPKRNSQILSNMRLAIILTGILLVTIFFFLYSMFIILRQKRLSEMQKDFINNMTHEFKTPISTIRVSADVFLKSPEVADNPRLRQYASIIQEQNQRLNNQVEKVLQLAKVERDNFKLNIEDINLHELLKGVLDSTKLQVEKLGGTLACDLSAVACTIRADRLHLTNILHNLVDNATKYCKDVPRITISTQNTTDNRVKIEIKDQGIGISKDNIGKVFDKFYRVPTGNVHNVKGFGLGLFYTKNICDAHNWRITVDSQPNIGTTVSILM